MWQPVTIRAIALPKANLSCLFTTDVACLDSIERAADQIMNRWNRLDVLINNRRCLRRSTGFQADRIRVGSGNGGQLERCIPVFARRTAIHERPQVGTHSQRRFACSSFGRMRSIELCGSQSWAYRADPIVGTRSRGGQYPGECGAPRSSAHCHDSEIIPRASWPVLRLPMFLGASIRLMKWLVSLFFWPR